MPRPPGGCVSKTPPLPPGRGGVLALEVLSLEVLALEVLCALVGHREHPDGGVFITATPLLLRPKGTAGG